MADLIKEWNLDHEISGIYLDNASTTYPKPHSVYDFMARFYRDRGVSPDRGLSEIAADAGRMAEETRKLLMRLFNIRGKPERMVLTGSATQGANIFLQGFLKKGDHAIATMLDHNAVLRPLNHLARDREVETDFVPFDEKGYVQPEEIEYRIRPNTKLVVVNHGSNVLGTLQPLAEIGSICRKHGVLFMADVSQSAGAVSFDAGELDILFFPGHKSLYGPTGTGGLYVREGVEVVPLMQGGTGILSENPYHLDHYPHRLETGTPNILGIAGLYAGVRYIEEQGVEAIHEHEMTLYRRLVDGLQAIPCLTLYCAGREGKHLPVVSFNIECMHSSDVGNALASYGISSRPGLHCAPKVHERMGTSKTGTVRLSIGAFNTQDHVDATIDAIREIAKDASG